MSRPKADGIVKEIRECLSSVDELIEVAELEGRHKDPAYISSKLGHAKLQGLFCGSQLHPLSALEKGTPAELIFHDGSVLSPCVRLNPHDVACAGESGVWSISCFSGWRPLVAVNALVGGE